MITEAFKLNTTVQGKNKVNIFAGRFQPFTLGHLKVLEQLYKQNSLNIVIFLVKAKNEKKDDAFSRPYDLELQTEMLNKLKKDYKFIEDVIVIDNLAIDKMFNALRGRGYEPVLWGTGTDRIKSYSYQVDKEQYREELNCLPDFKLFEIKRGSNDISATQVRNYLLEDNKIEFGRLVPKCILAMYDVLKNTLLKSMKKNEVVSFFEFIKLNKND